MYVYESAGAPRSQRGQISGSLSCRRLWAAWLGAGNHTVLGTDLGLRKGKEEDGALSHGAFAPAPLIPVLEDETWSVFVFHFLFSFKSHQLTLYPGLVTIVLIQKIFYVYYFIIYVIDLLSYLGF